MSNTLGFEGLSEIEASIILYVATVVADGEVRSDETKEFVKQVRLVTDKSGNSKADFEQDISGLLAHLEPSRGTEPLKLTSNQIRLVANTITDEELRITVMNAVFEIAFSDDDYHDSEREIVRILREIWGV